MTLLTFSLGFIVGAILSGALAFWLWMKYGRNRVYIHQATPKELRSIVELQPYVKWLMESGVQNSELYIQTKNPAFMVRLKKIELKSKTDEVEIDIRSSDDNGKNYEAAKTGLTKNKIDYKERLTPKQKKPKDMRVRVEIGTFAPAVISNILSIVASSIGCGENSGIYVSDQHPAHWRNTV